MIGILILKADKITLNCFVLRQPYFLKTIFFSREDTN